MRIKRRRERGRAYVSEGEKEGRCELWKAKRSNKTSSRSCGVNIDEKERGKESRRSTQTGTRSQVQVRL
jgi:hypothetical protein